MNPVEFTLTSGRKTAVNPVHVVYWMERNNSTRIITVRGTFEVREEYADVTAALTGA